MKTLYIDFAGIGDYEDFFDEFKTKALPDQDPPDNLESLSGFVTNPSQLPLHLEFVNLSVDQLETFEDLLLTLEDAEEVADGLTFTYYLEQYEDEE